MGESRHAAARTGVEGKGHRRHKARGESNSAGEKVARIHARNGKGAQTKTQSIKMEDKAMNENGLVADIVSALRILGNEADLPDIYYIVGIIRASHGPLAHHFRASIRCCLQTNREFKSCGAGRWRLRQLSARRAA